jgi:hypothetical protein
VERAVQFLSARELRFGSDTKHNAEERTAQSAWLSPCFPRFYYYDVLRGLHALVRWAEVKQRTLPARAVADVVRHLADRFPDGVVRVERQSFAGTKTRIANLEGVWVRGLDASSFPLLDATSKIGAASPTLTRRWAETRAALIASIDQGRITGLAQL